MEQRKVYEFGYTVEGYSPVLGLVGEGSYLLCFNLYFWKNVQTYLSKVYTAENFRSQGKSGWGIALLWITHKLFRVAALQVRQLSFVCSVILKKNQTTFAWASKTKLELGISPHCRTACQHCSQPDVGWTGYSDIAKNVDLFLALSIVWAHEGRFSEFLGEKSFKYLIIFDIFRPLSVWTCSLTLLYDSFFIRFRNSLSSKVPLSWHTLFCLHSVFTKAFLWIFALARNSTMLFYCCLF